jgi:hypothetical protein
MRFYFRIDCDNYNEVRRDWKLCKHNPRKSDLDLDELATSLSSAYPLHPRTGGT